MIIALMIGFFLGVFAFWGIHKYKTGGFEHLYRQLLDQAEKDAEKSSHERELKLKEKELEHQR